MRMYQAKENVSFYLTFDKLSSFCLRSGILKRQLKILQLIKHTLVYSQAAQTQWKFVGTLNLQAVIITITISLAIKMFLYNIKIKKIKKIKIFNDWLKI